MTAPHREQITTPGAWRGSGTSVNDGWVVMVDGNAIDEIDAALAAAKARGLARHYAHVEPGGIVRRVA